MKGKQVWAKSVAIALLVALATFTSTGLVFADQANPAGGAIILADHVDCQDNWVTPASGIPGNILDEICYAGNREVASESTAVPGVVPSVLSWVTEGSNIPADILKEINFLTNKQVASESAVAVPSYVPDSLSWVTKGSNIPADILNEIRYWKNPEVTSGVSIKSPVFQGEAYWKSVLERDYGITP